MMETVEKMEEILALPNANLRDLEKVSKVEQFYLQDKRSYVGNSMLWWKHDDCGYVCDIRKAKVWTKDEAKEHIKNSPEKYVLWPKDYIDDKISHHIDMQHVSRENTHDQ